MASISLTEIVDVRVGPNSKTFLNNVNHIVNPNLCFSMYAAVFFSFFVVFSSFVLTFTFLLSPTHPPTHSHSHSASYTRGRTLDLEAVHPEDLKIWMNGLTYLVDPERRSIDDPTRGEWMSGGRPGTKRVGQGGDLLSQLEKHVEHAYRNGNALEGIADWVALRRQTGIPPAIEAARNNKPDVVNVDEMFLAGPYRTGAPQACHSPPSYPVPDRQTQSPYSPHHHHSPAFKQGLEEGRRVAALSPPGPGRW